MTFCVGCFARPRGARNASPLRPAPFAKSAIPLKLRTLAPMPSFFQTVISLIEVSRAKMKLPVVNTRNGLAFWVVWLKAALS